MHSLILIVFCASFTSSLNQIIQKRDVVQEVQKSSGRTNMDVIKFQYEWTIENFSLFTKRKDNDDAFITSDKFTMNTPTRTYYWILGLNDCKLPNTKKKINVSLMRWDSNSFDRLYVDHKFTVLNDNKTFSKIQTKDLRYSYSNRGSHNGDRFEEKVKSEDGGYEIIDASDKLRTKDNLIILFEGECMFPSKSTDHNHTQLN